MNKILIATALATALVAGSPAFAQAAPMSTDKTTIGAMMENADAKAVLAKHMPQMVSNPQFAQAAPMTLKQIQEFAPDMITAETLKKIDEDLAKIPAK
jgi:hypothetical protein